jgi:hypothetical protein
MGKGSARRRTRRARRTEMIRSNSLFHVGSRGCIFRWKSHADRETFPFCPLVAPPLSYASFAAASAIHSNTFG